MSRQIGPLAGLVLMLLAAAFATWASFRQFGGYDLSPLVDLFWRMGEDQIPGRDFIDTWPPLLLVIAKLVGRLHLGWFELTLANIIVTLLSYAAVIGLTDRKKRSIIWCIGVGIILIIPLVYTNHIWHSGISQLCAIIFFFTTYLCLCGSSPSRHQHVALFLSAAILAVAKQNVALPILAATLVLMLVAGSKRRWRLAALVAAGSASGIALYLLMLGMSFESFAHTYTAVLGRSRSSPEMVEAMIRIASTQPILILVTISVALLGWSIWSKRPATMQQILLFAGFIGLSLLPILSDWDAKLNNISLPLFVVATHVVLHIPVRGYVTAGAGEQSRAQVGLLIVILFSVLVIAVTGGFQRERMYHIGPGTFYELPADHIIPSGYFAHMRTGKRLAAVVHEIDRLKASAPLAKIFFGPRIEFGYAETRTSSPAGLPLWWHPGTSYSVKDDERHAVDAFQDNKFDMLIFLKNDRTRMPRKILDIIKRDYRIRPSTGALDIYDRRKQP